MFDDFDGEHAEFTAAGKILRLAELTPAEPTANFDAWMEATANHLLSIDQHKAGE